MGFKKANRNLDFANLALVNCLEQDRSIKSSFQGNGTAVVMRRVWGDKNIEES